jgi:hypothetical protein
MKRKLAQLLLISGLFVAGSLNSIAQQKKPIPQTEENFKILASQLVSVKVVKGAPYSATAITETMQTLSDGNQITRKNESKLYRDSEGRTRMERTLETIGTWTAEGEARQNIFINDPVAGVTYILDPRTRTATRSVTAQKEPPRKVPNDPELPELKKKLETLQQGNTHAGQRKTESLGSQTIEGVAAEGTRVTLTIPPGKIGNTLPLEIVDETWYSPELQITVMTKHRDPRSGESTYRLTNINRGEPDRSLFEVPADYALSEPLRLRRRPAKEEQ